MGYILRFPHAKAASAHPASPLAVLAPGGLPLGRRLAALWQHVCDALDTMADYAAATARYEDLSRLSGAELARRGLSRDSLTRHAVAACDRDTRVQETR